MKKFVSIFLSVIFMFSIVGCGQSNNKLIRIHIRANSNDSIDQSIKYEVKKSVVNFLDDKLSKIDDYYLAYNIIKNNLNEIVKISNLTLQSNGFSYKAKAEIINEYFPARSYEGVVVDSGYYDALIIELGTGKGDNWWCVIYPPLCFISNTTGNDFQYKSLIKQLWENFINKRKLHKKTKLYKYSY